jgi:CubicO group peptidase (beta-lactamase class C family)
MGSVVSKVSKIPGATACFATLLTLALSTTGLAQTLDKVKLDKLFDKLAEKRKAMGSLVIAKDGQIIYSRAIGYGQISATEKKPLTAASRFGIASITKTYTAVMILQLVEEGKLKLTDPLDKFFPQVPNAGKITIAQMLTHRSGIPNVIREDEPRRNAGALISKEEMLALIVKGTPDFEPDSKSSYSNSGYFVLALILEKVTGKSYAQVFEERIALKVGLKDTYMASATIDVSKNESLTYWSFEDGWKLGRETHPSIFELVSTPSDMARFIAALFDLKLISQDGLAQMQTIRDGEGLGIVPFKFAGTTFYGHTGGGDNYGAWLMYQPEEKLAVAYATNAKVHPVKDIIGGVMDICYNRPFEIPAFDTIAVSPEILEKYVGVYSSPDAPVKWTISREGSTLSVQPGSENAAAVEATAPHKFQLFAGRVTFEFDAAKNQMILNRGGRILTFTKEK